METQTTPTEQFNQTQSNPAPRGGRARQGLTLVAIVVSAAVLLSTLVGTLNRPQKMAMVFDGPEYSSIEDLATTAGVKVRAKVTGVHSRQIDYGGEEPGDGEDRRRGLPLVIYKVRVKESYDGQLEKGDLLHVAMINDRRVASEHVVKLDRNQEVVLFLNELSAEASVGVAVDAPVYVPLNNNNGVLTVEGPTWKANGTWLKAATAAEAFWVVETEAANEAEFGPDAQFEASEPLEFDAAAVEKLLGS